MNKVYKRTESRFQKIQKFPSTGESYSKMSPFCMYTWPSLTRQWQNIYLYLVRDQTWPTTNKNWPFLVMLNNVDKMEFDFLAKVTPLTLEWHNNQTGLNHYKCLLNLPKCISGYLPVTSSQEYVRGLEHPYINA